MLVLPGYETIYEARFGNDSKIQWVDTFMEHQVQQPVCDLPQGIPKPSI